MPGPAKIMFIRHGEKPEKPPPHGVKEDGSQSNHSLIPQGWQRAGALIAFFAKPVHNDIATPTRIYAAAPGAQADDPSKDDVDKSHRPVQTVTPLSRRLELPIEKQFSVGEETGLVADIQRQSGIVLICWEHKHIPLIARPFTAGAPSTWPDRYDIVWILDAQPDGSYDFTQAPQLLLSADQPV